MVKKDKINHLDFIIDKVTNSIENTVSGDSFQKGSGNFYNEGLETIQQEKWLAI